MHFANEVGAQARLEVERGQDCGLAVKADRQGLDMRLRDHVRTAHGRQRPVELAYRVP